VLVFETGCPYRKWLEDWFALKGEMPERMIEMSSYHAMLGCAVVGMGISLLPRMVLGTFPERKRLSIHELPPKVNKAVTWLVWRKGARSPKLSALMEILAPKSAKPATTNGARPTNGKTPPPKASKAASLRP
jgi:DNA-binding transcriptional LysR family regulator